jgi:hypothetical protein
MGGPCDDYTILRGLMICTGWLIPRPQGRGLRRRVFRSIRRRPKCARNIGSPDSMARQDVGHRGGFACHLQDRAPGTRCSRAGYLITRGSRSTRESCTLWLRRVAVRAHLGAAMTVRSPIKASPGLTNGNTIAGRQQTMSGLTRPIAASADSRLWVSWMNTQSATLSAKRRARWANVRVFVTVTTPPG